MGNILEDLREARNLALDQFMIQEMDEEYLEVSPIGSDDQENLAQSILSYAAYMNSSEDNSFLAVRDPIQRKNLRI